MVSKHLGATSAICITLHRASTWADRTFDLILENEIYTKFDTATGEVQEYKRLSICGYCQAIVPQTASKVKFYYLDPQEAYFPTASCTTEGSFFGLAPAPEHPSAVTIATRAPADRVIKLSGLRPGLPGALARLSLTDDGDDIVVVHGHEFPEAVERSSYWTFYEDALR
ncbi:MAG: hypothetical protein MMC23_001753 [Stictis urceolatum]|nr:hypothetical protein [Stictis urceolata]